MHLKQESRLGFIFFFSVCMCFAETIIKISESDEEGITEAAVNILESCYGNHLTTLGLAGNFTERFTEKLWSWGNVAVTFIDDNARMVTTGPGHPIYRHKLQFFVVSVSSSTTLATALQQIKDSIWWNHMANFLILNWPLTSDGCSNAFEMLWIAWEMNILKAKYLCNQQTKGRSIYTYNPYTNQAPGTWKIEKMYSGKDDHPWTLFVRGYGDGEGVCNELDFDKTSDLGGYQIRASVIDEAFNMDLVTVNGVSINALDHQYYDILIPPLNATCKILLHHSINSLGYFDVNGNPNGILAEVINGSSDIGLLPRFLTTLHNTTCVYPILQVSLHTATQYRGYKSQLGKIVSVIDRRSRFGLCLVFFITILFFKYLLHQPMMIAYLSTLRIICNTPLPEIPRKVAPRIYLGALLLLTLTMQGIYQGQLASVLTKEVYLRNVNTRRDLIELGHTVYGSKACIPLIEDPEFEGRLVEVKDSACIDNALRDPAAACLGNIDIIVYDTAKYKLHMSADPVTVLYSSLPIRPDWPLEERLNTILSRSVESHQIKLADAKLQNKVLRDLEIREKENDDMGAKVLKLKDLSFAFAILGMVLGCATISFVIEVRTGRSRNRISSDVIKHVRNRSKRRRKRLN